MVNNSYQQASKLLFTFAPNKQFGLLITITPHLLKTTSAEFSFIEIWFKDQNHRPFETVQKKIYGSGTTTLIISNEEINDIMKIVQALEDSNILLKGPTKTIKNETREQKGGFLSMLLGKLGASLLSDLLTENLSGKGTARAGKGTVRAGEGTV